MASITPLDPVLEESVCVITVAWLDEDGSAVTPSAATWSLSDLHGTIVNNREDVTITDLATSNDIVLEGDDLVYSASGLSGSKRQLLVKFTYNSDAGSGLKGKAAAEFEIINLAAVS